MCLFIPGHTYDHGIDEMHVMMLSFSMCYKAGLVSLNQLKQILQLQKTNAFLNVRCFIIVSNWCDNLYGSSIYSFKVFYGHKVMCIYSLTMSFDIYFLL